MHFVNEWRVLHVLQLVAHNSPATTRSAPKLLLESLVLNSLYARTHNPGSWLQGRRFFEREVKGGGASVSRGCLFLTRGKVDVRIILLAQRGNVFCLETLA